MALCVALRDRWAIYGTGLALVAYLGLRYRRGRRGFLCDRYGTWNCDLISTFILYGRYGTHIFWVIWIVFLRGRCDTYGVGLALVTYAAVVAAAFLCGRHGAWNYTLTSTFTLCGRCGTLRRRRGTWRHVAALCWLWWRAWVSGAAVVAAAFCVANVALGNIHLRFTWYVWYLMTSIGYIPLLYYLYFCISCDIFGADKIILPILFVTICHHIYIYPYIHPYIYIYIHTYMYITQFIHIQIIRTYSSTYNLLTPILHHLFSLSCFPHAIFTFLLFLVGRKLICGIIRSFNY